MKYSILYFAVLLMACAGKTGVAVKAGKNDDSTSVNKQKTTVMPSLHSYTVKDIEGKDFPLVSLKGKKIMIVNVASECGLTPQYENLQKLYTQFKDSNFVIIGFPANNFGAQEPGDNDQIAAFCSSKFNVTFPMMEKISVQGDDTAPIYQWLTQQEKNGVEDGKMIWNFQKFLIDEQGHFVRNVHPRVLPDDPSIVEWIRSKK